MQGVVPCKSPAVLAVDTPRSSNLPTRYSSCATQNATSSLQLPSRYGDDGEVCISGDDKLQAYTY
eukprot:5172351-Pyramimonas_sp.AAC.1